MRQHLSAERLLYLFLRTERRDLELGRLVLSFEIQLKKNRSVVCASAQIAGNVRLMRSLRRFGWASRE